MALHPDMNSRIAEIRIQELIAEADRQRLVRSVHPRPSVRIAALRLAARGLRVEREIDFQPDCVPGR
jgi:hypothetical protein